MASQTQQASAETVVQDYIAVYNTHDLDASSKKIAPDIVISSPLLAGVRGLDARERLLVTARGDHEAAQEQQRSHADLSRPVVCAGTWSSAARRSGCGPGHTPTGRALCPRLKFSQLTVLASGLAKV